MLLTTGKHKLPKHLCMYYDYLHIMDSEAPKLLLKECPIEIRSFKTKN